jgi:hypothetical protein
MTTLRLSRVPGSAPDPERLQRTEFARIYAIMARLYLVACLEYSGETVVVFGRVKGKISD